MSGIVGIYRPEGLVANADLERMVEIISHRGGDGSRVWTEGPIGLGHRMLQTTPESLQEKLPLVSDSHDLTITADARIDNREELWTALGFSGSPHVEVADSQLILASYERWGERCPEKLLGDFSFAIWDRRKQELFCARDHYGVRPFNYHYHPGQAFVFGSEIKALLCVRGVPRRLNELMVGYHLGMMNYQDKAITFYQDIFRLPPAHGLIVGRHGMRLWAYWALDPARELRLGSDDEYAEAFGEIFTEAVHCRLRSAFPVGSQLSGGLDSSSVTSVARNFVAQNGNRPLHTVSMTHDVVPQCDERPFIDAVLCQGKVESHYVDVDDLSPLGDMDRVFWHEDQTYSAPTLYLVWALLRLARQNGVRVLLDGLDGDTAVSHGEAYMSELARNGEWVRFAAEARLVAERQFQPESREMVGSRLLELFGLPYLTELARSARWMDFAKEAGEVSKRFALSRRKIFLDYGLKPLAPGPVVRAWRFLHQGNRHATGAIDPIVKPEFAKRTDLQEHMQAGEGPPSGPLRTSREEHHRQLNSELVTSGFELTDRAASAFSIEARHPFADRRLLEFCLALPPEQKLYQGWSRIVMRRAMNNVLPQEVQWRGGKTNNSAAFTRSLLKFGRPLLEEVILHDPSDIEEYVDVDALPEAYRRYLSRETHKDGMRVWTAVALGLWLRRTRLTPVG